MAPYCCAVDCVHTGKNSTCKLRKFPADPIRAQQWENNIRRDRWERKSWHVICTCHFDESQWEQRPNGPKLKRDAQPLVFETHYVAGHAQPPKKRKHRKAVPDLPPVQEIAAAVAANINPSPVPVPGEEQALVDFIDIPLDQEQNDADQREIEAQVDPPRPNVAAQNNLEQQLQELKAKFEEKSRSENELWKHLQEAKKKLEKTETEANHLSSSLAILYNKDQLCFLKNGRAKKWSKETMRKSLQLRFAVGVSGYKYLLETGHPYPSYSTLCRRVQKIPTDCGVSSYTIDLMSLKAPSLHPQSRKCILSLDEMELTSKTEFDLGTRKLVGNVTLGNTSNKANKLLLLIARGVSVKWKQVTGWHLTDGHSATGKDLWQFIEEGMLKMEESGYFVLGAVSDMGASNQAIWAYLGVKIGSLTSPHPARPTDPFYWFADVPHLLKNLRSGSLKYDIVLPPDVVQKNNLPTAIVSKSWIVKLIDLENDPKVVFKAAPHLHKKPITDPNHYETMKVMYAQTFFSEETAVGIEVAVKMGLLPKEALTTAWFCRQVAQWYKTMTSRHVTKSITLKNFDRKVAELESFADMVKRMTPQSDQKSKPYQRGIFISTMNTIELARSLLFKEKSLRYFLGSRLTQDALENIFSVVRSRGCIMPTPLQALRAVRLIAVAQFTREVKGTSYNQTDDMPHLDFLQSPKKSRKVGDCGPATEEDSAVMIPSLQPMEADGLDHFTGSVLFKCIHYACDGCQSFCTIEEKTGAQKTMLSDKGGLTYPAELTILAGRQIEAICQVGMKNTVGKFFDVLLRKAKSSIIGTFLPVCTCRFAEEFCLKFIRSRVYFTLKNDHVHYLAKKRVDDQSRRQQNSANKKLKAQRKIFASKSGNATAEKHL